MAWQTKVPYPQVIRRTLEALSCPLTVIGVHRAAEILRTREADAMRIPSGEFEGCWDKERINAKIAQEVLVQYPSLNPIINDFREEGSDYSDLCRWLNGFIESLAWLGGNRAWPCDIILPVKREFPHGCLQCGLLGVKNSKYDIRYDDGRKTYDTVLGMALDGWSVD